MVSVPGDMSSASVPLWLLGVEGGREQNWGGVSRLVWLPLGYSCLGARTLRGFGKLREPRELLTSPKKKHIFFFPHRGLFRDP